MCETCCMQIDQQPEGKYTAINTSLSSMLKVHFVIYSLIPPFFSTKVEIFIPVEAFRYILFVLKIFLANLLAWRSNRRICVFFMSTWKLQHIVAYATGWYSKTCITHKRNLRIDWKFGNKLFSSISIDVCYKNSMLWSQNGPLINIMLYK